jgi:hypothetical protein
MIGKVRLGQLSNSLSGFTEWVNDCHYSVCGLMSYQWFVSGTKSNDIKVRLDYVCLG